jgi:glycosidase
VFTETAIPTVIPQPTSTETIPAATASTAPTTAATKIETIRLVIRLATTSDWTNMFLISGATWQKISVISTGDGATTAEMQDNQLVLDQAISRAEAGESVEMVVEVLLKLGENKDPVVFKVERGDIGSTQVEFTRQVEDQWVGISALSWDRITGDGVNAHSFQIAAEELSGEPHSDIGFPQGRVAVVVDPVTGMPQGTDGYPWWNDSVGYEIFVRSFNDSDGDGIGDFNGLTERLDYLNDGDPTTSTDLGVTCIWLMPIYPSLSYHGYNVTDYYSVNPDYGTIEDFNNLLDAAHARGIRVILDITLNHTSSQHPWFIEAKNPSSTFHDWYIWSDTDPGYAGSWGQQVWFPYLDKYYYSTFSASFADLNYNNPEVNAEMQRVVRFWLEEIGVDGFRLDAAKHMIEERAIQANSASTHAWWKGFRTFYKEINPQAFTVGEIWDTTAITAEYLQGDEFDLSFDFYLAALFIQSVNKGSSKTATNQIERSYTSVPPLQFAPFLTNHDQDRLINQVGNDPQKVMIAASLNLTAPGMPFLYYGEEIGMEGQKPDEQIRRPMQWSTDPFAGFSTVYPWEPLGPGWETYNVALETADPASILSHYRNLIQARNQHAALRVGDLTVVATGNDALYGILRVSQQEAVLVLINLSGETVSDYALSVEASGLAEGNYIPAAILGEGELAPLSTSSTGGFSLYVPLAEIPPYTTFILQLQVQAP